MEPANPTPPGLHKAGRDLWTAYTEEYDFGDDKHALTLLETAARHADTAATIQNAIDRDGAVFLDRFQQPKAHPGLKEARAERNAMVACLSKLGVDLEPVLSPGRPAGGSRHGY